MILVYLKEWEYDIYVHHTVKPAIKVRWVDTGQAEGKVAKLERGKRGKSDLTEVRERDQVGMN